MATNRVHFTAPADIALIDGNALAFRALFATEALSVKYRDGVIYTGIPFGFLKALLIIKRTHKPEQFIITWDGGSARRKAIYPGYKAGRTLKFKGKMTFDDVITSIDKLQSLLKFMGIRQFRTKGEEADDLLAALVKRMSDESILVVSSDHDLFQLLRYRNVRYLKLTKQASEIWSREAFMLEHKFDPKYYAHYLALVGDTTDKIPGIAGIGEKSAAEIISQASKPTISRILKEVGDMELKPRVFNQKKKDTLLASGEEAYKWLQLTKLDTNVELTELPSSDTRPRKVSSILETFKFKSILNDQDWMRLLWAACTRQ